MEPELLEIKTEVVILGENNPKGLQISITRVDNCLFVKAFKTPSSFKGFSSPFLRHGSINKNVSLNPLCMELSMARSGQEPAFFRFYSEDKLISFLDKIKETVRLFNEEELSEDLEV